MKLLRKGLIAFLIALGLTAQAVLPADAQSVGAAVYVVRIQTSVGLGYPVLTPPNNGTFKITQTIVCADVSVNNNKPGKNIVEGGASCLLEAEGTFAAPGGNCGRSAGTVEGKLTDSSGNVVEFKGTFETAASVVLITAAASKPSTGQTGTIIAVADATPDPLAGTSCTNKTQREFIVVGVAVVV